MSVDKIGWPLDSRGFKYDRQWMVVTATGVALTQKTEPRLCLINPHLSVDGDILTLSAAGKSDCLVPVFKNNIEVATTISLCQSKVCGDRVLAIDCGDNVANWLSDVLSRPGVRLVKQSIDDTRITKKTAKKKIINHNNDVDSNLHVDNSLNGLQSSLLSLSNQAQFLLINMSSVLWLSEQLPSGADCNKENLVFRFRSNFVVSSPSLEAFAEQKWSKVEIGGILFKVVGPCSRCQMICIDQFTGKRTKEPLTSLAASLNGKLQFGIYLEQIIDKESKKIHESDINDDKGGSNFLRIGDKVICYNS